MYDFKKAEEIGWAMAVGGGIFLFEILSKFDPNVVTNWETWLVAVAGGLVRAIFGAALAYARRS
jgi:hypothetical protein